MGLRDDAEEAERIGGQWDWFNRDGAWTPHYCAMTEVSRRMAQMIWRARAEARAAQDAVTDHASRDFVLQQINRILEALQ